MKEKTEILKAMDALQIYGGNSPADSNESQDKCPTFYGCTIQGHCGGCYKYLLQCSGN